MKRMQIRNYLQVSIHSDFDTRQAISYWLPDNPNQDYLVKTVNAKVSKEEYDETLKGIRKIGRDEGIDKALADYKIDVILGPADSPITKMASASGKHSLGLASQPVAASAGVEASVLTTISGYPIATLPLGYLDFNGRPFGMVALASANQEQLLLKVMGAWEETFPNRVLPPMLQQQAKAESGGTKLS